jgi:hypothetical protein
VNQQKGYSYLDINVNQIEKALSDVRTYEVSGGNATLEAHDFSAGTVSRSIQVANIKDTVELKNETQVPAVVSVWLCSYKRSSSKNGTTLIDDAIADQWVENTHSDEALASNTLANFKTSGLWYPSELTSLAGSCNFTVVKKDHVIKPGDTLHLKHNTGSFRFSPHERDNSGDNYDPKFRSYFWLFRFGGATAATTAGPPDDGGEWPAVHLPYVRTTTYKFAYNTGASLNDLSYSDDASRGVTATFGAALNPKNGQPVKAPYDHVTTLPARV